MNGPNHNVASSPEGYLRPTSHPTHFGKILLLTEQTLRTLTVVIRTEPNAYHRPGRAGPSQPTPREPPTAAPSAYRHLLRVFQHGRASSRAPRCARTRLRVCACAHARSPLAARPVRLGVKPDSVLDNTARLPFSLREFALPMRDWPLTFTPLIEHIASMDYCNGFVLLSPSPMREHRHLKERWLAGARKSLEDISVQGWWCAFRVGPVGSTNAP